jgi:hypothetical protein
MAVNDQTGGAVQSSCRGDPKYGYPDIAKMEL